MTEKTINSNRIQLGGGMSIGTKAEIIIFICCIVADILVLFLLPNPNDIIIGIPKDIVYMFLFFAITMVILIIGRSIGRRGKTTEDLNRYNRSNRLFLLILMVMLLIITIVALVSPSLLASIFAGEIDPNSFWATFGILKICGVGTPVALVIAFLFASSK